MPAWKDSHTKRPARLLGAGSGPSGLRPRGRIPGWCVKKCRVCSSCDLLPLTYTVGWQLIRRTVRHPLIQSRRGGSPALGLFSGSTKFPLWLDRGFTQRLIETTPACMPHPPCSRVCHALGATGRDRMRARGVRLCLDFDDEVVDGLNIRMVTCWQSMSRITLYMASPPRNKDDDSSQLLSRLPRVGHFECCLAKRGSSALPLLSMLSSCARATRC